MSCSEQESICCNETGNFSKKADFEKAIGIVKNIKEGDLTLEHQYMDQTCHGCLVGHILKVTDGLTYDDMVHDASTGTYAKKDQLLKERFGNESWYIDSELSSIHGDYADDYIDLDEMKQHAIECLTKIGSGLPYEYVSKKDDDWDDEDEYYDDDEEEEDLN